MNPLHASTTPPARLDHKLLGVILSAGKGSRIDPFNAHYPKPMLPIVNRPILEHQIEQMKSLGIDEIIIVVGHLQDVIRAHFGDGSRLGVSIRYVEQKQTLGIAHAVMQLERVVQRPFLLFLGDIFYVPKDLEAMVRAFGRPEPAGPLGPARSVGGVLAVKLEDDPEAIQKNFSVTIDEQLRVSKVVEKPRYLANRWKGCGMYLFGPEIFDAIRRTPRTAMRDEYELTTAVQIFIDDGYPVKAVEVVDWDYNITFPVDLLNCNAKYLGHLGQPHAIAPSAKLHPGCRVESSVIGDDVVVDAPLAIVRSILLPGTRLTATSGDITDCVISKEITIRCPRG